jgi:putative molybdopterin biosynthesis protein
MRFPDPEMPVPDLMNTREVAAYLRLKERKVYDLLRTGGIPCVRVTGRWLFPKDEIDRWLAGATALPGAPAEEQRGGRPAARKTPPPVIAGSHDPLLDWCLAESGSGLALLGGGSLDGLGKLAEGRAAVCGLHVLDAPSGAYNAPAIERHLAGRDVVAIEWAQREQGLVLAAGNPLGIGGLGDLARSRARVIGRQAEAGSRILFDHLARGAGLEADDFAFLDRPARSEIEVGLAVLDGRADAGLAIRAVARQLRLDFVPLHRERYDLAMHRRDFFEPPVQALLAFARGPAAAGKAADLAGYDISGLGRVRYNAP